MRTCALVGATDFNEPDFLWRRERGSFDAVYAVDGGFAWLERAGVVPDLAVGDFDSLGFVPQGVPVERHPPMKDASDMELALERAWEGGFRRVFVYGGIGGRLDHTLANLGVLAGMSERGMEATVVAAGFALRFFSGPGSFGLADDERCAREGVVSVFSLSDLSRGVTEQGLLYELHDADLTSRASRGLSNELVPGAVGGPQAARVSVQEGTLAVVYPLAES